MMYRRYLTLALMLGVAVAVRSQPIIPDNPHQIILQNSFSVVRTVGDYVIGMQDEALVILEYNSNDSTFQPIAQEWLDVSVVGMKVFDSILAVRCFDDAILFFDASDLPTLNRLGRVSTPTYYDDYVFANGSLYLSLWFDGIQRYTVENYSSLSFADSSMIGVLVTELNYSSDTLYAIDRYNGIMRYDVSDDHAMQFIDYMLVPFEVIAFAKVDSVYVLSSLGENAYLGMFGLGTKAIVDSIENDFSPTGVFATEDYIGLYADRFLQIVDRKDYRNVVTMPAVSESDEGDIVTVEGSPHILLPTDGSGLTLYSFDHRQVRRSGLSRPGPIADLMLRNGRLFVSGIGNPIDVFEVDTSQPPKRTYSIYPDLLNARAIESNGDTLLAYYGFNLNRVAIITHADDPDSALLESSFTAPTSPVLDIRYPSTRIDTLFGLYVLNPFGVDAYSVSDSSIITFQQSWSFFGGIDAVEIMDTVLAVATNKRQLQFYTIQSDFSLDLRSSLKLSGTVDRMLAIHDRLWVLESNRLKVYDYSDPDIPNLEADISLPFSVVDIDTDGPYAYAIGGGGLVILSITDTIPEVVSTGGRGGAMIEADRGVIAVSDARSVSFYYFPNEDTSGPGGPIIPVNFALSQNYPNPFNGTTTINFALESASFVKIDVFNQVGHRVAVLEERHFVAGNHSTAWDGRSIDGQDVASGVYFYRLTAGDYAETRRMLFVK